MNCNVCGKELKPAPARFDGEATAVGYLPCEHTTEALITLLYSMGYAIETHRARRHLWCSQSGEEINPGDNYYLIWPGLSGVSGKVNADRILPKNLEAYVAKKRSLTKSPEPFRWQPWAKEILERVR